MGTVKNAVKVIVIHIPKFNVFHQVINAQFTNVRKKIYGMNIKYV